MQLFGIVEAKRFTGHLDAIPTIQATVSNHYLNSKMYIRKTSVDHTLRLILASSAKLVKDLCK